MNAVLAHRSIPSAEGLSAIFGGKALHQLRIRMKFFLPTVKLLAGNQNHRRVILDRVDCSAYLNCLAGKLVKVSYRFFIAAQADDKEMAVGIRSLGTAYIQEVNSLFGVDNAVDVRGHADIFIDVLERFAR